MIVQTKPTEVLGEAVSAPTDSPVNLDSTLTVPTYKFAPVAGHEFFTAIQASNDPSHAHTVVTWGSEQVPNDHYWVPCSAEFGKEAERWSYQRTPAYFSLFSFPTDQVSRWKGRSAASAIASKILVFEVEGSAEKYAKPGGPDGGYSDGKAALTAVTKYIKSSGVLPNFLVLTGSGGLHVFYLLSQPIGPIQYKTRSNALLNLCIKHGLKVDPAIMADPARIMRAPGSFHQATKKEVKVVSLRQKPYCLDEIDVLFGFDTSAMVASNSSQQPLVKYDLSINGDVLGDHPKFSYATAAQKCGAMRIAADRNGQETPYPVWLLALKTAALSIEGPEFAHEISSLHDGYDEAATDKKIDSLTGGPANCEAWAKAYGSGSPCAACEWRGKIKNPAVQLGALVATVPPGETAAEPGAGPEWVRALNGRFALVRHGSKLVVADFQTPIMTGQGVSFGLGYLDVAALRSMKNGQFAPVEKPGDKMRSLADAWLAHPARRQYEGLIFAPGEALQPNILNLWQGYPVKAVAGDVSLWLEVLGALLPNELERRYVLRWIAWKVQNPGGVPDTILIFKGAKGAGKNSLFDPLILLFGRHAMLADDPELIAGRFTWHLMVLAFAVLDEAVFIQDPRQADRIKSRVTAKTMMYEQKGMDPVPGVNRCAYVMLTNHEYVWQASNDERRAVVIEVGQALREKPDFWTRYHPWAKDDGPAALLHYLQGVDLTGFNPREIPKGEALRKQIEQTALRAPAAAWWHQCLTEGTVRYRDGGIDRVVYLNDAEETEIDRTWLRQSYEQSAGARGRVSSDWAAVARRLNDWAGPDGIRKVRARTGSGREWRDVLPALSVLREAFQTATNVQIDT